MSSYLRYQGNITLLSQSIKDTYKTSWTASKIWTAGAGLDFRIGFLVYFLLSIEGHYLWKKQILDT